MAFKNVTWFPYTKNQHGINTHRVFCGRKVAGKAYFTIVADSIIIRLITVKQEFRGMGFGTRLLKNVIEWAKLSGSIRRIILQATGDTNNPFSVYKWYKRYGFEPEKTSKNPTMILKLC